jgi:chromosome segregation ATPase
LRAIFKEFEMSNEQSSTERSKLFAEIQQTESDLASATTELGEERKRYDPLSMAKPTDGARALAETVSRLGSRLKTLQDEPAYLDKAENYAREIAEAPALSEKARKEAVVAERQAGELSAQIARLRERITGLQTENTAAEERARNGEAVAAKKYAESIGGKLEAPALAALEKAQAETATAMSKVAATSRTVQALTNQAEALEEEAGDAQSEAQSLRQTANEADVTVARGGWDVAAGNLVEAGARLVEACSRAGLANNLYCNSICY